MSASRQRFRTLLLLSLVPLAACLTKSAPLGGLEDDGGMGGSGDEGDSATSIGQGESDGGSAQTGTGDAPGDACGGGLDAAPSTHRYLDPTQWRNAVVDLLTIDAVPDLTTLAYDRVPFHVASASGAAAGALTDGAATVATALPDGYLSCGGDVDACLTNFIHDVGARAWRRTITDAEVADLLALPGATSDDRVRAIVQSILEQPAFYDITETGDPDPDHPGLVSLHQRAIATRIAHLVWNSVPDAELLARAANEELFDPDVRRQEIARMWADPRAERMVADYTEQWLSLDRLRTTTKDFPEWSDDLPEAMIHEAGAFAAEVVVTQDGTWNALLTAPLSVINGTLAQLVYGDDVIGTAPAGDAFELVDLDPARRGGLLSLSGPMAAWTHPDIIGITGRGLALRQRLLCGDIPPPPPDVDTVPGPTEPYAGRHEFQAAVISDPACAGCHALFDPMTFAFDNYDPMGRWQTELTPAGGVAGTANDVPVEPYGEVAFLSEDTVAQFDDRAGLLEILSTSPDARTCVVTQHVRFAFGRTLGDADACIVEQLAAAFEQSGGHMAGLFEDIAAHDAFVVARL